MSSCLFSVILRRGPIYRPSQCGPLFDDSSRTSSLFLNSSFLATCEGPLIFLLSSSISIREFIPNIRWTFILFLTTGPFIFLFIEVWKVHFFSFHFLTLRATMSFVPPTWPQPPSCLHAGRSFSPSFFSSFLALILANLLSPFLAFIFAIFCPCLVFILAILVSSLLALILTVLHGLHFFVFYFIPQYEGDSFHR